MAFKKQLLQIMEHPHWEKGFFFSHDELKRIIIEQLDFSDRRTIAKWLGHNKTTWKKKVVAIGYVNKVKQVEWVQGLLEDFFIIEKLDNKEAEQLTEYVKDCAPYFKILKDKTDFQ